MTLNYFDPQILAKLESLELRARTVVEGLMAGIHRSRAKGFSSEFEQHREYTPGDDLRHLDWKAYGKFDRYFIKEFQEESNLKCYVLLDCSASMGYRSDGLSKFEYGCYLAACLSYLSLRQGDAAALVTFGEGLKRFIPPRAKQGHLREICEELEARRAEGRTNLGRVLQEIAEAVRRRGMVVVISDLLDDRAAVMQGLKLLRFKGNDLLVFQVLDRDELELPFKELTLFRDLEQDVRVTADPRVIREEYLRALQAFIDAYREECRANQIDHVLLNSATPLDKALIQYLAWRA